MSIFPVIHKLLTVFMCRVMMYNHRTWWHFNQKSILMICVQISAGISLLKCVTVRALGTSRCDCQWWDSSFSCFQGMSLSACVKVSSCDKLFLGVSDNICIEEHLVQGLNYVHDLSCCFSQRVSLQTQFICPVPLDGP